MLSYLPQISSNSFYESLSTPLITSRDTFLSQIHTYPWQTLSVLCYTNLFLILIKRKRGVESLVDTRLLYTLYTLHTLHLTHFTLYTLCKLSLYTLYTLHTLHFTDFTDFTLYDFYYSPVSWWYTTIQLQCFIGSWCIHGAIWCIKLLCTHSLMIHHNTAPMDSGVSVWK